MSNQTTALDFINMERRHHQYGLSSSALSSPLVLSHGHGVWLYDVAGARYLDLFAGAGIASLGHAHPLFVQSIYKQLQKLIVSRHTTDTRASYVTSLAAVLPSEVDQISFFSTGAEANEAALRIARSYSQRTQILSFWGAYHGKTAGVAGMNDAGMRDARTTVYPEITRVPYPDRYHRVVPFSDDTEYLQWCLDFARSMIRRCIGDNLAAIVVEPIQGTAGNVMPVGGLLSCLRALCDEVGALLIVDEIITGFGRTGSMFCFEKEQIIPDILVIGKGMGNGIPISAVVTSKRLLQDNPVGRSGAMSSSFGGNPLAMAAADTTLDVILRDNLVMNAEVAGNYWLNSLRQELAHFDFVGDIRGIGLLIGIELVRDRRTKEPLSATVMGSLSRKMLDEGLIVAAEGSRLRLNPPLIFTLEDAAVATRKLRVCFEWLHAQLS